MSRLRIGARIYLGFGLVLALLMVLGTVSYLGLRTTDSAFGRYEIVSTNTVRIVSLDRVFTGLRRNVMVFAVTGKQDAIQVARERGATLQADLKILADALLVKARRVDLDAIGVEMQKYLAGFEMAVKLRKERDVMIDEQMNVLGASARRNLSAIIKSAMADGDLEAAALTGIAEESLMQQRIYALRFLNAPEQKYVDSFNENDAAFQKQIGALVERLRNPERKRLATETVELGAKYRQSFQNVTRHVLELDTLVNKTMAAQAETVGAGIAKFVKSQRESLDAIQHEANSAMQTTTLLSVGLGIGALLAGVLIAFLIARGIVRPVSGLTGGMKELAGGNFDVELPGLERADEIGEMGRAIETFKVLAAEKARREAEEKAAEEARQQAERHAQEQTLAEQKAAEEARQAARRREDMHRLADDFQQAVGNIVNTVSSASVELEAAAGTLMKTADVTQGLAGTVAATSEQASANVQSVASATEEMTSSVNEIARQVHESTAIADSAVRQAQLTDQRIAELSKAASRIGDVVKLITAIAEQTNLLALNATIEAARAGEAGRGFAVVASEVKALAAQTGKATEDISTQIAGIQAATQDSVTAIKEIGGTIGRISEISSTIAAAVAEQEAATGEIARNVTEAAKGTSQVATNIHDVSRGAGETGSASSQVLSSAQSLSTQSTQLKIEVEKFLSTVRAA